METTKRGLRQTRSGSLRPEHDHPLILIQQLETRLVPLPVPTRQPFFKEAAYLFPASIDLVLDPAFEMSGVPLDIWMAGLEHGVEVAPQPRITRGPHDLHV